MSKRSDKPSPSRAEMIDAIIILAPTLQSFLVQALQRRHACLGAPAPILTPPLDLCPLFAGPCAVIPNATHEARG